jgi:hypothetical protein
MRLAPNSMPEPRLISSLDAEESEQTGEVSDSPFVLKGAGVFSGNGRWIYIGMLAGALSLAIFAIFFGPSAGKDDEQRGYRMFIKARTHSLAVSPHSAETPAPVVVQLSTDVLRVSAIALGHPRLAIVNGKPVSEGDTIVVHTPIRSVALTLRVVKISDGWIDFSDGAQVFSAQLTLAPPTQATPR